MDRGSIRGGQLRLPPDTRIDDVWNYLKCSRCGSRKVIAYAQTLRAAKHTTFRSLHTTSPVLNGLIALTVIGKPYLDHLQKNNWDTAFVAPELATPLVIVFIVSLYAMLGVVIYFFFQAIRNLNFFNGSKLRSPYSALLMLIPITNLIVIPYLQYFTYHWSRVFAVPQDASKPRSALLAFSAFGLIVTSVAFGLPSDQAAAVPTYDALSSLVLTASTAGAGGILTTRIITGIAQAQDLYAQQRGLLRAEAVNATAERRYRSVEMLKSAGVGILLIAALMTVVSPTMPSRAVEALYQLGSCH
jgi:hypothetical protein